MEQTKIQKDALMSFLNKELEKKIDEEEFSIIKNQIDKLLKSQKLNIDDMDYLGHGQSYVVLGIGNAVLKIGPEVVCLQNPFQELPFHQEDLKTSKQKIYLSQRGKNSKITNKDIQKMYNQIRDSGGLWIDPKENNLAIIESRFDFSKEFNNNIKTYNANIDFNVNDSNLKIVDYEDIIFITPEIIKNMDKSSSVTFLPYGNNETSRISTEYLELENIDEIYYKNFINKSETLLDYEKEYQISKGNLALAKQCGINKTKIIKMIEQIRYEEEQRYKYERRYGVGKKYSAKEIGIRVMQKTNITRLKSIIEKIRNLYKAQQKMRNIDKNITDNEQITQSVDKEEIIDKEGIRDTDPYRTL